MMIQEQIDMIIEHITENKNLIKVDQINKDSNEKCTLNSTSRPEVKRQITV